MALLAILGKVHISSPSQGLSSSNDLSFFLQLQQHHQQQQQQQHQQQQQQQQQQQRQQQLEDFNGI